MNILFAKMIKEVGHEKYFLLVEVSGSHACVDCFKYENSMLVDKVKSLGSKLKD